MLAGAIVFVGAALLVIIGITLVNLATASRLSLAVVADASLVGRVSALIPARDEAATIGRTLDELLRQDPPPLEVIVLDDGSTDGTAEVAQAADARAVADGAPGAGRTRVIAGEPPAAGWAGKPWACRRLGLEARGDLLLFTDADTRWAPGRSPRSSARPSAPARTCSARGPRRRRSRGASASPSRSWRSR